MLKIAFLSAYDHNQQCLADYAIPNKQEYCKRHGYDFIAFNEWNDKDRSVHWAKIKYAANLLKNYHWIFYSDIDSIIMNHNKKLEDFLDHNYDFIASYDRYGINSGQWFIRRCNWAATFLTSIYSQTQCINQPCPEQMAMITTLINLGENLKRTKLVNQKQFNSYLYEKYDWAWPDGQYTPGDFLLHLPGMSNEERVPILKEYSEKVIK